MLQITFDTLRRPEVAPRLFGLLFLVPLAGFAMGTNAAEERAAVASGGIAVILVTVAITLMFLAWLVNGFLMVMLARVWKSDWSLVTMWCFLAALLFAAIANPHPSNCTQIAGGNPWIGLSLILGMLLHAGHLLSCVESAQGRESSDRVGAPC